MASEDNAMTTELVYVPREQRGLVIGARGKTIREIEKTSGVREIVMTDDGVHLRGTQQQIEQAKQMIFSIIQAKEKEEKKDVTFDPKFSNLLIGPRGATIRRIQNETGTKIRIDRNTGVAHITGHTQENLGQAEQKILALVSQKQKETLSLENKDVDFPAGLAGLLIGPKGNTLRRIQEETGTEIWIDGENSVAQIKGPTQKHIEDAEQRIKTLISENKAQRNARSRQYRHKPDRFALVDCTCIGEDNYFRLEEIKTDDPKKVYHKLVMEGDIIKDEAKEMDISELEKALLKVLRKIRDEVDGTGNIRTDMWCHFGHARIHSVDEADAGETFDLNKINENLQETENSPWKVYFKAGVEKLEYEALEEALKERELRVQPNTRFDYTFTSPTGHRIRFKAFVPDSNGEDGCFSFQDDIVPIKNTLADQSAYYKYRLCAPSPTRLKVDILIPFLTFDCHLVLRTTMREVKDVSKQEEDQILIDFLDENLKYENKNITLPLDKLPSGFSVVYRRQADRWTYPYSMVDPDDDTKSDFNVMLSKEESQEESHDGRSIQDEVQTKTDIHVHSDEWDKLLDEEDWEPEAIVSKLPAFLKFLRDVQQNIKVPSAEVPDE